MLNLLDDSLEDFLRAEVPLSPRDVDIAFEAPDRDWEASVSRPTVNLFLWDVRRNGDQRQAAIELIESEDGRPVRRPALPRLDCRYLVTAWTAAVVDEHALLGAVLAAVLLHRELPPAYLPDAYAAVQPLPTLGLGGDGRDVSDFWSALGGQLKPGLDLLVTATLDASVVAAAGPPVNRMRLRLRDRGGTRTDDTSLVAGSAGRAAGGTRVRSRRGSASVDEQGRFLVKAEPGDEVHDDSGRSEQVPQRGTVDFENG